MWLCVGATSRRSSLGCSIQSQQQHRLLQRSFTSSSRKSQQLSRSALFRRHRADSSGAAQALPGPGSRAVAPDQRVRIVTERHVNFQPAPRGTTGGLAQTDVRPRNVRDVVVLEVGQEGQRQHGYFYFTPDQYVLSPWHDLPLFPHEYAHLPRPQQNVVNVICAMPRHTSQRFELKLQHSFNPLGPEYSAPPHPSLYPRPRYCKYDNYFFHECVLPQTWCDSDELAPDSKWPGADTPLQLCDIGQPAVERGELYEVAVLGVLGLLERPFLHWKLIGINRADPRAALFRDIGDVERHCAGLLAELREFYRGYQSAGSPAPPVPTDFVFSGEWRDRRFALEVLQWAHDCWRQGCVEGWEVGTRDPELYFKWFSRRAENVADHEGGSAEFLAEQLRRRATPPPKES